MSRKSVKTPLIYALEPRLLFDGDLGADVASAIVYRDGNNDADVHEAPAVAPENQRENITFEFHSARTAIVFIDGALEDTQTLIDAVPASAEVHILNGDSDGFDQINEILENHDRVDEIHIFGHGAAGEARLGTASLSLETLTTHSDTLAVLKNTLTEDGDILLYGCDIAAGEDGQAFIEELAELTAADIAASDDITGAGGDWELEVATGPIETETIIASDYLGRLSNGVTSTTNVTEVHGATDLETGSGHAGDGQGIQITQEQTGIQTGAELNFNLGSNLTNDANLQLDSYLVYRNATSGQSNSARIVFDNGIAGINWVDWRSDDSGVLDAQFAKPGASYDDLQGRGLESSDQSNVSFSGRVLNISGSGLTGDADYMRVFVYSSPATITAVDDTVTVTESVNVETSPYQAADNINLVDNDTTTSSSKRVVGLGSSLENINDNPAHDNIGSLGLSAIAGVYGELRVASNTNNTISYWVTDDAALETAIASANGAVTETFYYRVANEFGSEDEGQLTITINQANDPPVAQPYTIIKDYDAAGFTIGTASSDHPLVAGNISDADSSSFTFSGIHENTSSNITLANAKQEITIADFGTITVNANDELVFMPDAALANLPLDQTISRSFIYFVSDDGGAYNANEAGTSVDRGDTITITINGQADIPVAQVSDVARFYFENNNSTTPGGRNLSTQTLNMLGNYDLSYAANPTQHGQSNLATGNIVSSLWSVEGEGNTITFDSWVDADGNEVNGRAYSVSRSDSLPNGPYIDGANLYHINGQVSMFTQDGSLAEGQTGTYTWYYRVNVENSGNVVSSAIGQLDITLQGTNDDAESSYSTYTSAVSDTENGQRITTPVTQSVNIYDTVQDPDSGDTIRADRIRINVSSRDGTLANYVSHNDNFYLNRGQSTDDENWDQAAAWGELANHFSFTFNEDGTIDWVSKREAYRSHGGNFTAYVTDYTEIRPGADDISHTNENLGITKFQYRENSVEFIDDSVSVSSSAGGSGSVDGNDFLFTTLASFQRTTGNYNVREAAGETIVGEYITLTMNADGSYSYTVNQAAYDALADGETASESFTYWGDVNTNAGNAVGEATLTFNITGLPDSFVAVNDTARVVAGATISGSAGDIGNQSSLSVYETSGGLTSNDINDVGNLTVVSFRTGREADGSGTDISLTDNSWTSVTNGQIRWYNNSYEFQASGSVTSEVTEYFTYTVENGDGEADTAELAITIVPTTDNEFVVADNLITMTDITDEAELTKTNIGVTLISSGRISSGNKSGADYGVTGYAAGEGGSGFSNVGQTIRGTYGTLTITSDGVPTYVFDRPYSLNAGERGYDVFTFEVTDGRDPATTNTAQFTVQINGQNTTPSWSSDAAIAIAEDTGVVLTKYGDVTAQGSYITRTSNGDGTYVYTYDANAFNALGDDERGYNTALTGGWSSYLIDEIGDVDSYQLRGNMASYGGQFDDAYVERSSSNIAEGWTSWRMSGNGSFPDDKIGAATNRDTILIGSVPFGSNNTNDQITKDNAIAVGESQTFSVGSSSVTTTGSDYDDIVNIRGTFDVTVIGIQNTEVVSLTDDSASEPALFRFGNFYEASNGGQYPTNTLDLFSNDTTSDYSNIDRIEISANGTSGWTPISKNNNGVASNAENSPILNGSDFYWRGGKDGYADENWIEFSPSNFEALGPDDGVVSGEFYYRIVELDGRASDAARVSATLTPVDDPAEVHRQGAVLYSSGTISVGASEQPNWNYLYGGGVANPGDTGVNTRYLMGTGNHGDGISILEVDRPGEHTGGLLDKSNSTSPADPEDNSVILSVTPRYMSGATTSELQGLGNNSDTSVTLRGNHGELTVNEDGSYSYNADTKRALNWMWNNSYENYDYFDSFDIQIGSTGVGGAGSVTTTLDIFFDGTDTPPVAENDTAHVRENENIAVSGNAAAITAGGDDDTAVDAPGEHSGNLLANDTDVNENADLYVASGGVQAGNTLNSGTDTDNPYRTDAGTYGTITIYRDGSYTYVADQQAADNLAAGETAEDIFYYRVYDNQGDFDQGTLTITVHGTANEAYDREVETAENQTYNFVHTIENNVITETDFWTPTDVDSSYNPPIQIISLPHSGTLRIGTTEILADDLPQQVGAAEMSTLNYIPPDDTHGDNYTFFTYEILDVPSMGDVTVTMTIDILPDGNNAPPTVTDPTTVTANISEIADGATGETTADVTASGSFDIADGDNNAVTVSETNAVSTHSGGSVLGTLTINPITNNTDDGAGVVTWSYAINDSHLDVMAVGESFTETFTLTVDDGNGGTVTQDIVITVNGANDAPVTQADYAAIGEGETLNVADAQGDDYTDPVTAGTSTGDVLDTAATAYADTDIDGDTLRVSAIAPDGGSTTTINAGGNAQVTGAHGVLTIYAHGGYDYTANRNVTEAGATEIDSFTYTVNDDNGGTTTATLQITITDVPNNPPTVEVETDVTGSVTELDDPDATEDTASLTTSGSFTIADLDNDGVSVSVAEAGTTREGGGFLGALTPSVDNDTDGDGSGVIGWTYTIPNSDIGGLDIGQNFSETFTITVTDTNNGTVTQDVTVTVNGANDVPNIQNDSYTVSFGNTLNVDAANGVLANDSDDDDQDVLIVDAAAVSAVDFNTVASGADMTELVGTYGSLTIDTDGSFIYTPDANNAALQALDGTETLTETFYIDVHDGNATTLETGGRNVNQLDIVISGVNDAPSIDPITGDNTEDDSAYTIDLLIDANADDADGDAVSVSGTSSFSFTDENGATGDLPSGAASVDGTTLNIDPSVFQGLDDGESVTIRLDYSVTDGIDATANTATITVTGVNDAPTITPLTDEKEKTDADYALSLIEGGNDVDGDNLSVTGNPVFEYVDKDGQTATLPEGAAVVNGNDLEISPGVFSELMPGESITITVTYDVTDGDATISNTAVITVIGVNTPPVINDDGGTPDNPADDVVGVADVTTVEDTVYPFVAGDFNFSDADAGGTLSAITIINLPDKGSLQLNDVDVTAGQQILVDDIANLTFLSVLNESGLDYTEFDFTVNDGYDDSVQGTMTIHVTPLNDPPTASPIERERTKLADTFSVDLINDANATDIDGDTLVAINDGENVDNDPVITVSRSGTTRVMVTQTGGDYHLDGVAIGGDGFALNPGRTYIFDWSEAPTHPLRFSETSDGTHNGGDVYDIGVDYNDTDGTTTITVTDTTPALHIYCAGHPGMGFAAPMQAYEVPTNAFELVGSTLTVNPQIFADLASDNEVEIAIAYKIADGDVADEATYVIDNTATITITGLNTKPQIIEDMDTADNTSDDLPDIADVTTPEDTPYVFTLDDFNYVDQDNDPMDNVLIIELPGDGTLTLGDGQGNDVPITAPDRISRAEIEAGLLKYTPPADENGVDYTVFTYAVNDGTEDSDVGAMTVHVTPVNDAPTSQDRFVGIIGEMPVVFGGNEFAFDDVDDGDSLNHITLRSLPENGSLYLVPRDVNLPNNPRANGKAFAIDGMEMEAQWEITTLDPQDGLDIPEADLSRLVYLADSKASDLNYDEFTFTVNDGSEVEPASLDSEEANRIVLGQLVAANKFYVIEEDTVLDSRNSEGMGLADEAGSIANLTFDFNNMPARGELNSRANGHFEFKPEKHFYDVDDQSPANVVEYTVSANGMTSEPGKITIIVNPKNDRPDAVGKVASVMRSPDTEIRPIPLNAESLFADIDRYDPRLENFSRMTSNPKAVGSPSGATFDNLADDHDGVLSYTVDGLPEGLEWDGVGAITGTTSEAGRHLVTVTATDGGGLSRDVSFFIDILKPVVEPIDLPEPKEPPKREVEKPREKRPELNPHDLPPVMKVAAKPNENRQITDEPDFTPVGRPEIEAISDDNAGLADDSWMNDKTSSQLDISGNIRVIDLKVEGREIAVQITDEASDRAERFKGELADGSPLPSWVKVDRNTGLTTADPPPGAQPFEMRVVAEDGGGNSRAIDLVLDPTLIAEENGTADRAADRLASNTTNEAAPAIIVDSRPTQPNAPKRDINPAPSSADVLADGRVAFADGFAADPSGSLKLMRMVSETNAVKVEIADDARAEQTRYEVRQKDGSAAPDWVKVNAQTGELTIEAPTDIAAIELTLVALDGGAQRTMDLEVDLEEMRLNSAGDEPVSEDPAAVAPSQNGEELGSESDGVLPVSQFVPLDAQISAALTENSYGHDIQEAVKLNA